MNTSGGCSPKCPSSAKNKSDTSQSPGGRSRTRTTTRTNVASVSRSPLYVDDATLNAMVANLETFGHGLGQFSPQRAAYPPQSTPGVSEHPSQLEAFGPQMDYNMSYIPREAEFGEELAPGSDRFLLSESELMPDTGDETIASKRQESIIEWFDRSVEQELEKRRDKDTSIKKKSPCAERAEAARADVSKSPTRSPNAMKGLAEANASGIEIIGELLHERDADLIEAVEKLATAEAMCNFAGAVEAAEEAAKSVPQDCAEEAAAAGARGYQKEITNLVQQTIPGEHPIEVVGYIGVTRPKNPRKPNH